MIDGNLRTLFRRNLKHLHWQAIETGGTGRGIPDSNYCGDGVEGWVEFKFTATTNVPLRSEQAAWHHKRARHGGLTFVAVRQRHSGGVRKGPPVDRLWLLRGDETPRINQHGLKEGADYILGVWDQPWDWAEVSRLLTQGR